jgi:putative sterol carrier protein
MTDAVGTFFDELAARRHEPLVDKVSGTLCVDLADGARAERWYVTVERGDVTVTREATEPGCTIAMDRALFARMVRGEVNAMAAILRGEVIFEGDVELALMFQRLFPGPPAGSTPAGETGRRS